MARVIETYTTKDGETNTLSGFSKKYGISLSSLFTRINKGMTIDEALVNRGRIKKGESIRTYKDEITGEEHSVEEWARITGIKQSTIYNRINTSGYSVHDAVTKTTAECLSERNTRPKDTYKHIDLTGRRFGNLTVIRRADNDYVYMCNGVEKHEWKWLCKCDCGNMVESIQHNLLNGHTTSCGCKNSNNFIDMTGQKIGHLTVLHRGKDRINYDGSTSVRWVCQCDCPDHNIILVDGQSLRNGHTTSCGCMIGGVTHGGKYTRLYGIYSAMKSRCYNPNAQAYLLYGGRGIYICPEWLGENGFVNFRDWAMNNGYSDDLTIDRINVNGIYEPSNCRWATMKVQSNNRRNNIYITYNGITHTATEWGELININPATIISRYHKGWTPEQILFTPVTSHEMFCDGVIPAIYFDYGNGNITF